MQSTFPQLSPEASEAKAQTGILNPNAYLIFVAARLNTPGARAWIKTLEAIKHPGMMGHTVEMGDFLNSLKN